MIKLIKRLFSKSKPVVQETRKSVHSPEDRAKARQIVMNDTLRVSQRSSYSHSRSNDSWTPSYDSGYSSIFDSSSSYDSSSSCDSSSSSDGGSSGGDSGGGGCD